MSDLIRRQEVIIALRESGLCYNNWLEVLGVIDAVPSADRPTGEWINREKCQVDEDAYEIAICSECGAEITLEYSYDSFCPNCGAKMGGRAND